MAKHEATLRSEPALLFHTCRQTSIISKGICQVSTLRAKTDINFYIDCDDVWSRAQWWIIRSRLWLTLAVKYRNKNVWTIDDVISKPGHIAGASLSLAGPPGRTVFLWDLDSDQRAKTGTELLWYYVASPNPLLPMARVYV